MANYPYVSDLLLPKGTTVQPAIGFVTSFGTTGLWLDEAGGVPAIVMQVGATAVLRVKDGVDAITVSGGTTGRQIRWGTTGIQDSMGMRYSAGDAFLAFNALQATSGADSWTMPWQSATTAGAGVFVQGNTSVAHVFAVGRASPQAGNGVYTTFWSHLTTISHSGLLYTVGGYGLENYANANVLPDGPMARWTINTGGTNYPTLSGVGLRVSRAATSPGSKGSFWVWSSDSDDKFLYYRKLDIGGAAWGPWKRFASLEDTGLSSLTSPYLPYWDGAKLANSHVSRQGSFITQVEGRLDLTGAGGEFLYIEQRQGFSLSVTDPNNGFDFEQIGGFTTFFSTNAWLIYYRVFLGGDPATAIFNPRDLDASDKVLVRGGDYYMADVPVSGPNDGVDPPGINSVAWHNEAGRLTTGPAANPWDAVPLSQMQALVTGPADPTAKVTTAPVLGLATTKTYIRSDAAPEIDQGMAPTWTGLHTFRGRIISDWLSTDFAPHPEYYGSYTGSLFRTTSVSDVAPGMFEFVAISGLRAEVTKTGAGTPYSLIGVDVNVTDPSGGGVWMYGVKSVIDIPATNNVMGGNNSITGYSSQAYVYGTPSALWHFYAEGDGDYQAISGFEMRYVPDTTPEVTAFRSDVNELGMPYRWNIYIHGDATNALAGPLILGTNSKPASSPRLYLAAGTATQAPVRYELSGAAFLTTPIPGSFETDTARPYWTLPGPSRKKFLLDGDIGSGTVNRIPKWTPSTTVLGNSNLNDTGSLVTSDVALSVTGTISSTSYVSARRYKVWPSQAADSAVRSWIGHGYGYTASASVTGNIMVKLPVTNTAATQNTTGVYDIRILDYRTGGLGTWIQVSGANVYTSATNIVWVNPRAVQMVPGSYVSKVKVGYDKTDGKWVLCLKPVSAWAWPNVLVDVRIGDTGSTQAVWDTTATQVSWVNDTYYSTNIKEISGTERDTELTLETLVTTTGLTAPYLPYWDGTKLADSWLSHDPSFIKLSKPFRIESATTAKMDLSTLTNQFRFEYSDSTVSGWTTPLIVGRFVNVGSPSIFWELSYGLDLRDLARQSPNTIVAGNEVLVSTNPVGNLWRVVRVPITSPNDGATQPSVNSFAWHGTTGRLTTRDAVNPYDAVNFQQLNALFLSGTADRLTKWTTATAIGSSSWENIETTPVKLRYRMTTATQGAALGFYYSLTTGGTFVGQAASGGEAYLVINAYQPTSSVDTWTRMDTAQPNVGIFMGSSGFSLRRGSTLNTGTRLQLFDTVLIDANYLGTVIYTPLQALMQDLTPLATTYRLLLFNPAGDVNTAVQNLRSTDITSFITLIKPSFQHGLWQHTDISVPQPSPTGTTVPGSVLTYDGTLHLWRDIPPGALEAHKHPTYEILFTNKLRLLGRVTDVGTPTGTTLSGQEVELDANLSLTYTPPPPGVDVYKLNVLSAPKWTTARTMTFGIDTFGSVIFDGSAAIPADVYVLQVSPQAYTDAHAALKGKLVVATNTAGSNYPTSNGGVALRVERSSSGAGAAGTFQIWSDSVTGKLWHKWWNGSVWSTPWVELGSGGAVVIGGGIPENLVGVTPATAAAEGDNTTFLRSDAQLLLSQAIVPIWTGKHTGTVSDVLSITGEGSSLVWTSISTTNTSPNNSESMLWAGAVFEGRKTGTATYPATLGNWTLLGARITANDVSNKANLLQGLEVIVKQGTTPGTTVGATGVSTELQTGGGAMAWVHFRAKAGTGTPTQMIGLDIQDPPTAITSAYGVFSNISDQAAKTRHFLYGVGSAPSQIAGTVILGSSGVQPWTLPATRPYLYLKKGITSRAQAQFELAGTFLTTMVPGTIEVDAERPYWTFPANGLAPPNDLPIRRKKFLFEGDAAPPGAHVHPITEITTGLNPESNEEYVWGTYGAGNNRTGKNILLNSTYLEYDTGSNQMNVVSAPRWTNPVYLRLRLDVHSDDTLFGNEGDKYMNVTGRRLTSEISTDLDVIDPLFNRPGFWGVYHDSGLISSPVALARGGGVQFHYDVDTVGGFQIWTEATNSQKLYWRKMATITPAAPADPPDPPFATWGYWKEFVFSDITLTHSTANVEHIDIVAAGTTSATLRTWMHTITGSPRLTLTTTAASNSAVTLNRMIAFDHAASATDYPTTDAGYGFRIESTTYTSGQFQLEVGNNATEDLYFRKRVASAWLPWKKLAFSVAGAITGGGSQNRMPRWTSATNLDYTSWDVADTNPSRLRFIGQTSSGYQVEISPDATSVSAVWGSVYSVGSAFIGNNAKQITNNTDMWQMPFNNASWGGVIARVNSSTSLPAFEVRWAPPASASAVFATFFLPANVLISVSNAGDTTLKNWLTLKAAITAVPTHVLTFTADASGTARVVWQTDVNLFTRMASPSAGVANRMTRWKSTTELEATTWDATDSNPTKLKYLLSPTSAAQWEIASGAGVINVAWGGRYSAGAAFMSANARQTTNSADAWEVPLQNAANAGVYMGLFTGTAQPAFEVRLAAPLTAPGTFATVFNTQLFGLSSTGDATALGWVKAESLMARPYTGAITSARRWIGHGGYHVSSASQTGNILIKLPTAATSSAYNVMIRMDVQIIDYRANGIGTTLEFSGYTYWQSASSIVWLYPRAVVRYAGSLISKVKCGYDKTDNKWVICVKPTSTWAYPNIQVDAYYGFTGANDTSWETTPTQVSFVDDTYYANNVKEMSTTERDTEVNPEFVYGFTTAPSITHTALNTTHLAISPLGVQLLSTNPVWTYDILAAPKLIASNRPDGTTTSAGAGQFSAYTNTTGSTNYPTATGGGVLYERAGPGVGAFQLWADTTTAETLYYRKMTATSTWGSWKQFLFASDTHTHNYVDIIGVAAPSLLGRTNTTPNPGPAELINVASNLLLSAQSLSVQSAPKLLPMLAYNDASVTPNEAHVLGIWTAAGTGFPPNYAYGVGLEVVRHAAAASMGGSFQFWSPSGGTAFGKLSWRYIDTTTPTWSPWKTFVFEDRTITLTAGTGIAITGTATQSLAGDVSWTISSSGGGGTGTVIGTGVADKMTRWKAASEIEATLWDASEPVATPARRLRYPSSNSTSAYIDFAASDTQSAVLYGTGLVGATIRAILGYNIRPTTTNTDAWAKPNVILPGMALTVNSQYFRLQTNASGAPTSGTFDSVLNSTLFEIRNIVGTEGDLWIYGTAAVKADDLVPTSVSRVAMWVDDATATTRAIQQVDLGTFRNWVGSGNFLDTSSTAQTKLGQLTINNVSLGIGSSVWGVVGDVGVGNLVWAMHYRHRNLSAGTYGVGGLSLVGTGSTVNRASLFMVSGTASADETGEFGLPRFDFESSGDLEFNKAGPIIGTLRMGQTATSRSWTLPDNTGTVALTSDLWKLSPLVTIQDAATIPVDVGTIGFWHSTGSVGYPNGAVAGVGLQVTRHASVVSSKSTFQLWSSNTPSGDTRFWFRKINTDTPSWSAWQEFVFAGDPATHVPPTRSLTHTSANAHLTISTTGSNLATDRTWLHTVISAPLLVGADKPDANTTSAAACQFLAFTNAAGSTNYVSTLGGGIQYERAGTAIGAFQIWTEATATEFLYFRKQTGTSTWSSWKAFILGAGTATRLPRWKTANELESTLWEQTDTMPTKLKHPCTSAPGVQIEFHTTGSIGAAWGSKFNYASAFFASNARQPTTSVDSWEPTLSSASYGSVYLGLASYTTHNALELMWAAPQTAAAAFATYFGTRLFAVANTGDTAALGWVKAESLMARPTTNLYSARRWIGHGGLHISTGAQAGNMMVKLPNLATSSTYNVMVQLDIRIIDYHANGIGTLLEFSGYTNYASATTIVWNYPRAVLKYSGSIISKVKIGYDKTDNKWVICLKPTTPATTWAYPNVQVDAYVGHVGAEQTVWDTTPTAVSFVDDTYLSTNVKEMSTTERDTELTPEIIYTYTTAPNLTHTSINTAHLTISPTGAQNLSTNPIWSYTILAAPKLLPHTTYNDSTVLPTEAHFLSFFTTGGTGNFPGSTFGCGLELVRHATPSSMTGSFQVYSPNGGASLGKLYLRYIDTATPTWSAWKEFLFVGDTHTHNYVDIVGVAAPSLLGRTATTPNPGPAELINVASNLLLASQSLSVQSAPKLLPLEVIQDATAIPPEANVVGFWHYTGTGYPLSAAAGVGLQVTRHAAAGSSTGSFQIWSGNNAALNKLYWRSLQVGPAWAPWREFISVNDAVLGYGLQWSSNLITVNTQQVAAIAYVTRSIAPAAGQSAYKWRRLALNGPLVYNSASGGGGSRASARFVVADETSGGHDLVVFSVGFSYGGCPTITLEDCHRFTVGTQMIRKIRIVKGLTYDGAAVDVETRAYDTTTTAVYKCWMHENYHASGWVLQAFTEPADIPVNMTAVELDLTGTLSTVPSLGLATEANAGAFRVTRAGAVSAASMILTGQLTAQSVGVGMLSPMYGVVGDVGAGPSGWARHFRFRNTDAGLWGAGGLTVYGSSNDIGRVSLFMISDTANSDANGYDGFPRFDFEPDGDLIFQKSSVVYGRLAMGVNLGTVNPQTWNLPDDSGTIALTKDFLPITTTAEHESLTPVYLTISLTGPQVLPQKWQYTINSAPKLVLTTFADGSALPTAGQVLGTLATSGNSNYPVASTNVGCGLRVERAVSGASALSSFQLWSPGDGNYEHLWFRKMSQDGLTWQNWFLMGSKLFGLDKPDANTTSTGCQFIAYSNTSGSTNYPSVTGGGFQYDRAGATTGGFQFWAEASASQFLYYRKLIGTSTWTAWKSIALGFGTALRMARWKTADELETTLWEVTDVSTSPTKLKYLASPTSAIQMEIYGGTGICVTYGGRYSGAEGYVCSNARQKTYNADDWEMTYQLAGYGATGVFVTGSSASDAFAVRYAPPLSAAAGYATFWPAANKLLGITNAGDAVLLRQLTFRANASIISTHVLTLDADANTTTGTAQQIRETTIANVLGGASAGRTALSTGYYPYWAVGGAGFTNGSWYQNTVNYVDFRSPTAASLVLRGFSGRFGSPTHNQADLFFAAFHHNAIMCPLWGTVTATDFETTLDGGTNWLPKTMPAGIQGLFAGEYEVPAGFAVAGADGTNGFRCTGTYTGRLCTLAWAWYISGGWLGVNFRVEVEKSGAWLDAVPLTAVGSSGWPGWNILNYVYDSTTPNCTRIRITFTYTTDITKTFTMSGLWCFGTYSWAISQKLFWTTYGQKVFNTRDIVSELVTLKSATATLAANSRVIVIDDDASSEVAPPAFTPRLLKQSGAVPFATWIGTYLPGGFMTLTTDQDVTGIKTWTDPASASKHAIETKLGANITSYLTMGGALWLADELSIKTTAQAGTALTEVLVAENPTAASVGVKSMTKAVFQGWLNPGWPTAASGTINQVPKWTAATVLGNSTISDTGSLVTCGVPLTVTGSVTSSDYLMGLRLSLKPTAIPAGGLRRWLSHGGAFVANSALAGNILIKFPITATASANVTMGKFDVHLIDYRVTGLDTVVTVSGYLYYTSATNIYWNFPKATCNNPGSIVSKVKIGYDKTDNFYCFCIKPTTTWYYPAIHVDAYVSYNSADLTAWRTTATTVTWVDDTYYANNIKETVATDRDTELTPTYPVDTSSVAQIKSGTLEVAGIRLANVGAAPTGVTGTITDAGTGWARDFKFRSFQTSSGFWGMAGMYTYLAVDTAVNRMGFYMVGKTDLTTANASGFDKFPRFDLYPAGQIYFVKAASGTANVGILDFSAVTTGGGPPTGNKTWTFPDKTGTIALLSDITGGGGTVTGTGTGQRMPMWTGTRGQASVAGLVDGPLYATGTSIEFVAAINTMATPLALFGRDGAFGGSAVLKEIDKTALISWLGLGSGIGYPGTAVGTGANVADAGGWHLLKGTAPVTVTYTAPDYFIGITAGYFALASHGHDPTDISPVNAKSLIGNPTSSPKAAENIGLGTGLDFTGSTLFNDGVTTVAFTGTSVFMTSLAASKGAVGITPAWNSQTASFLLVAPSGASGAPTFRRIVAADLSNTGTASSTTFLAGNMQWLTPPVGISYPGGSLPKVADTAWRTLTAASPITLVWDGVSAYKIGFVEPAAVAGYYCRRVQAGPLYDWISAFPTGADLPAKLWRNNYGWVSLLAGTSVSITTSGSDIVINSTATGGGSGTVTGSGQQFYIPMWTNVGGGNLGDTTLHMSGGDVIGETMTLQGLTVGTASINATGPNGTTLGRLYGQSASGQPVSLYTNATTATWLNLQTSHIGGLDSWMTSTTTTINTKVGGAGSGVTSPSPRYAVWSSSGVITASPCLEDRGGYLAVAGGKSLAVDIDGFYINGVRLQAPPTTPGLWAMRGTGTDPFWVGAPSDGQYYAALNGTWAAFSPGGGGGGQVNTIGWSATPLGFDGTVSASATDPRLTLAFSTNRTKGEFLASTAGTGTGGSIGWRAIVQSDISNAALGTSNTGSGTTIVCGDRAWKELMTLLNMGSLATGVPYVLVKLSSTTYEWRKLVGDGVVVA